MHQSCRIILYNHSIKDNLSCHKKSGVKLIEMLKNMIKIS
jgi:hypothetical protein